MAAQHIGGKEKMCIRDRSHTGLLFVQRIYVPPSAQEGLYEKCMYRYKSIEGKAKRAAGGNYRSSKFADRRSSDGRVVERSPAI